MYSGAVKRLSILVPIRNRLTSSSIRPNPIFPQSGFISTQSNAKRVTKPCQIQPSTNNMIISRWFCSEVNNTSRPDEPIIRKIEDTWINQEANPEIQEKIRTIFGRNEQPVRDPLILVKNGGVQLEENLSRLERYKRAGLVNFNPDHATPTAKEDLSFKVLDIALMYGENGEGGERQALIALQHSISLNPYLSEAYYHLGAFYVTMKAPEAAIETLEKCIKLSPNFVAAYADLGAVLMLLKNYHKAIHTLQKALDMVPDNMLVLYNKAICHDSIQDMQGAISCYQRIWNLFLKERRMAEKDVTLIAQSYPVNIEQVVHRLSQLLAQSGNHDECIEVLETYLVYDLRNATTMCLLGCAYSDVGKTQAAIESFQNALDIDPESLDARVNLGMIFFTEGRFTDALVHLEHALELDSSLHQIHINVAHVHRMMGDYEKAIFHLEKALSLNEPGSTEAYPSLGLMYFNMGLFEKSKNALDKALVHFPESVEVHYHLGKYHKMLANRVPEQKRAASIIAARSHFESAYKLTLQTMPSALRVAFQLLDDANYSPFTKRIGQILAEEASMYESSASGSRTQLLCINTALLLKEIGRVADSVRVYQALLAATPQYFAAHYNLAQTYEAAGNIEKSIEHLRMAVELDPSMAEAQVQLGLALASQGNYSEAIPYLEKAVKLDEFSVKAWHALAESLIEVGRYHNAQQAYNRVIRLAPSDADAHVGIGVCFYHLKRYKDAEMEYKVALENDPNNHLALYNMSYALFAQSKSSEAIQALQSTLEIEPEFAHAHMDLGLALIEDSTQVRTGVKHLKTALQLDPSLEEKIPDSKRHLLKAK